MSHKREKHLHLSGDQKPAIAGLLLNIQLFDLHKRKDIYHIKANKPVVRNNRTWELSGNSGELSL